MAATGTQRAKATIHVSSLPAETTKDLLFAAFIPFGEIIDVQIPRNDEGTDPTPFPRSVQVADVRQLNTRIRVYRV